MNSKTTTFAVKIIKLEPINQILKIILQKGSSNRKELMESAFRLSHLQLNEKKVLSTLLYEFLDLFFLPGDKLETVIQKFHEINTTYEKPVYVKNYRFPQIHKKEVERQTADLLEQNIIQPSCSPRNAPIWIVPKKLDASGIQK